MTNCRLCNAEFEPISRCSGLKRSICPQCFGKQQREVVAKRPGRPKCAKFGHKDHRPQEYRPDTTDYEELLRRFDEEHQRKMEMHQEGLYG